MKHTWTNVQQNKLIELAKSGLSAQQIAFKIGVTAKQAGDKISSLRRKEGYDIPYCSKKTWWTQGECDTLIRMWNEGRPTTEICAVLNRSMSCVTSKASKLRGRGIVGEPKKRLTTPQRVLPARVIVQYVCDYSGLSKDDLASRSTKGKIVRFRHIACCLIYRYSGNSMETIGRMMGGRHHSTVHTSIKIAPEKYPREIAEIESRMFAMKEAAE